MSQNKNDDFCLIACVALNMDSFGKKRVLTRDHNLYTEQSCICTCDIDNTPKYITGTKQSMFYIKNIAVDKSVRAPLVIFCEFI